MNTIFITGANRGLGLELARQYSAEAYRVLATCRSLSAASELLALRPTPKVLQLELTDLAAIAELGERLKNEAIDIFIANAGILEGKGLTPSEVDRETWLRSFQINTIAPAACADAFVRQVARSEQRKLVAISSFVGSIGSNDTGGHYPYRASKSALNAVWRSFAIDHPEVIAALLSPGRIRTRMTNFDAQFSTEEAAANIRKIIAGLTPADTGRFLHFTGETLPW